MGVSLFAVFYSDILIGQTVTLGRQGYVYPDLGHPGGPAQVSLQHSVIEKISNDLNSRYEQYVSVPNSTVNTVSHNFGLNYESLSVILFSGVYPNLTKIDDITNWTISPTFGFEKTAIDVTTPSSGGPHDFAILITVVPGPLSLNDLEDVDLATNLPSDGQTLIYNGSNFIAGSAGDKSFNIKSITGSNAILNAGSLSLNDGREIALTSDLAIDLSAMTVIFVGDSCDTPANATTCYIYVDKQFLPSESIVSGRKISNLTDSTALRLSAKTPSELDMNRYIPIAYILTATSGNSFTGSGSLYGPYSAKNHTTAHAWAETIAIQSSFSGSIKHNSHYLVSLSGGALSVTLPNGNRGSRILFTDINSAFSSNSLTINTSGTETIDGNASLVLAADGSNCEIFWDGTEWKYSLGSLGAGSNIPDATTTNSGLVNIGFQSYAGLKNFTDGVSALSFSGNGSALTGLNASNLSNGTVDDARLPNTITSDITGNAATVTNGVYTLGNQTIAGNKTLSGVTTLGSTSGVGYHQIYGSTGSADGGLRITPGALLSNGFVNEIGIQDVGATKSSLGVFKHSGITESSAFLKLRRTDSSTTERFVYLDTSQNLMISANQLHIGTASGTVVGTQTSDERLKSDITPLEYGLEEIKSLRPIRYIMNGKVEIGLGAQSTQTIIPEAVYNTGERVDNEDPESPEDKLAMEYVRIVPVLINAIQTLSTKLDEAETRLNVLESN